MSKYKIADLIVQMDTHGRAEKQARPYLFETEEKAELVVCSDALDLHKKHPHLSEDDCEYIGTGSSFYRRLVHHNGIMLHASCVVVDDRAYLFSAPSGTGKSTHTMLWLKLFGERAYILNDDKPAIRVIDGEVFVYGTPWSGKNDCSRNAKVPLGGIAFVNRAEENFIRPMDPNQAIFEIMNQTVRSTLSRSLAECMETIGQVVSTGRVYELFCNMNISAAELSYKTMSEMRI